MIDHVVDKFHFVVAPSELTEVDFGRTQNNASLLHLADLVGRYPRELSPHANHQAGERRVGLAFPTNNKVDQPADFDTGGMHNRRASESRHRKQGLGNSLEGKETFCSLFTALRNGTRCIEGLRHNRLQS